VTRLVGAFAAGTIINPRLLRSQYYGGMIRGISFALHERSIMDARSGRVMNPHLAEYHVPVNADVPSVEAILVEEPDPYVNAFGIKGVGDVGITGTAGAIANAVWNATGVRVRRFPIAIKTFLSPPRDEQGTAPGSSARGGAPCPRRQISELASSQAATPARGGSA
jgi:xanthine dehydrogenase YagR molybdenum-binding subunit